MGLRVAFVLPRYGKSLGGGAETLSRELFLRLIDSGIVSEGEIWTTCALDHRTWENHFPTGESLEDGIVVRRFPVDERDVEPFLRAEHKMAAGDKLTLPEQLKWIENSVNSKGLYSHIATKGPEFDLIFFAPYLFATTFWGALIYPEKSVLIPCLHDEAYAYNEIFSILFRKVAGFFFNAFAELELAEKIFPGLHSAERGGVVGMGLPLDPPANVPTDFFEKFGLREKHYFLYSGRKELGKNVDLLLSYYEELPADKLPLILIGSGSVDFRGTLPEGVRDLGFVSEEEKRFLMRGALALIQPSVNESFSIVLLEALVQETPVVVHGQCAVTASHASEGSCGLQFVNDLEFKSVIEFLTKNPHLAQTLGMQGRAYVEREYTWEAVLGRAKLILEKIRADGQEYSNESQRA